MSDRVALIVGAGDGLGGAIARRFARDGFTVCAARRTVEKVEGLCQLIRDQGGAAHAFAVDAREEAEVTRLFETVDATIGPAEVVVFNPGAWHRESIIDMSAQIYRKVWDLACFGGFLVGREAARHMVPRGRGSIVFTGATASMRGSAGFAAFAGAKFGLRALAQSMARELGPKGIHVAHVVVDGGIDTDALRERFPDRIGALPADGLLDPDAIAESYISLCEQPRSAWTHELDLRPWAEKW